MSLFIQGSFGIVAVSVQYWSQGKSAFARNLTYTYLAVKALTPFRPASSV
ncbi:MAG: hypothetical protein MGG11_11575 [Trichodesmium sp. MAG_R03]|nr:hypothetical protein [Trichodesmium sp. MAG_R03]